MAKGSVSWHQRIETANKKYEKWETLFKCDILEDAYEGFQWRSIGGKTDYEPYVLNLIYSTIKTKLANILYQHPEFRVTASPYHSDFNAELAYQLANLKEGALNTVINKKEVNFVQTLKLAALDSFFRFGVVETGYAADWMNPNSLLPQYDKDTQKEIKPYEDEIPENERVYFKHIKAKRFRVSCDDSPFLSNAAWCGYYSFIPYAALSKIPGIKLPNTVGELYRAKDAYRDGTYGKDDPATFMADPYVQYCKVWNIFDNYKKERILVLEHDNFPVVFSKFQERNPFDVISWDERPPSKKETSFYPIPPVFNWLHPQAEVNRSREQLRNFSRRFIRKFWFLKGAIGGTDTASEIGKLSSNIDGEAIEVKRENAIGQIPNPDIGATVKNSLAISISDMNLISGTSSNAREQADRTTATESRIIDQRARIRESIEQMDFDVFVNNIGKKALLIIKENFAAGMWVKLTQDPSENFLDELNLNGPVHRYIQSQELSNGDYDYEVNIQVVNVTPERMAEEEAKFVKFLQYLNMFPQLTLSPTLIREAAYKVGYKNERVIREMQKAATLALVGQMFQGENGSGSPAEGSIAANAKPQSQSNIDSQLSAQLGA